MSALVEVRNVTRILTDEAVPVTLVRDVSFNIGYGEFVSVAGPSGSGKSSLMYLLGLLDQPTSGEIRLDGTPTTGAGPDVLDRLRLTHIGFVFQFHFLLPEFSALDNILLPMRKLGKLPPDAMRARAAELLAYFGLEKMGHKRPGQLSGGERQRVAIARAVANDPLLLLADEPSGNLDTKNADLVFKLFEKLVKEQKKTVVTITHDPALAGRADRQLHMLDGRLVG